LHPSLLLAAQYEWKVYLTFAIAIFAGAIPYALVRRRPAGKRLNPEA
jgi:putative exporter of polyketide antibiotics